MRVHFSDHPQSPQNRRIQHAETGVFTSMRNTANLASRTECEGEGSALISQREGRTLPARWYPSFGFQLAASVFVRRRVAVAADHVRFAPVMKNSCRSATDPKSDNSKG